MNRGVDGSWIKVGSSRGLDLSVWRSCSDANAEETIRVKIEIITNLCRILLSRGDRLYRPLICPRPNEIIFSVKFAATTVRIALMNIIFQSR